MKSIRYIILALSLTLFARCVKSDIDIVTPLPQEGNTHHIALSIASPTIQSRVASSYNEMTIRRGYIFAFEPDGTFVGSQSITEADMKDNGTQYPTITTNISNYDPKTDKIVAVFNYCASNFQSDFSGITPKNISNYFPLDKAYLEQLQSDLATETYELGMPMFANDFEDDDSDVHEIYRSLARIELYVNDTDVSTSLVGHSHRFTTENIKFALLNSAESGAIGFEKHNNVVGITGGTPHQSTDVVDFDLCASKYQLGDAILEKKSSSNAIYLYEFPYSTQVIDNSGAIQGEYNPKRLAILIEHEDSVAHPGTTYYYKLQLVDKKTNSYYDIKRNHDYRVVIKNVYSDGYTDLNEAYLMPPSNIEYEVFDKSGDLTFSNGQYAISMDEVLNYESMTIYGPDTIPINFDNIRRILPPEVTESLSASEIESMTNSVEFAVINDSEVNVEVLQNDFLTDPTMSDIGRSIKLSLSGSGECSIRLKLKLGNLEMGFDTITINKVKGEFGGNSSFDAHPCQLTIENQNVIANTWNSADSDFGVRNDGDNMVIYMGENATPVGYKSLNGYISSSAAANAYPYFEPKRREGYYSYYDLDSDPERKSVKKSKIVLNQLAPFYVGHFGSKAKNGPHYYNALIVEKIEEIRDTVSIPHKENGGLLHWSEQLNKVYYNKDLIYGSYLGLEKYLNFSNGLEITKYMVENNMGAQAIAAKYCYMKNDINGNGVIEPNEPIVWYLPAANQMLAMWVSKQLIDSDIDGKYYGFDLQHDLVPWYWTASEVAQTQWTIPQFENFVGRFNMLEGELNTSGRKGNGEGGYDDEAHVRCVRSINYDNTK